MGRKQSLPLPADWDDWTPQQRRAWARHPDHKIRCDCSEYGLGDGVLWLLDDVGAELMAHSHELCQPEREALL